MENHNYQRGSSHVRTILTSRGRLTYTFVGPKRVKSEVASVATKSQKQWGSRNTPIVKSSRAPYSTQFELPVMRDSETKPIDDSMRGAFNMCDLCIYKLEKGDENAKNYFELIFQRKFDRSSMQALRNNFYNIANKLRSKLTLERDSVFVDENGKPVDTVLSAANPNEDKTIKIYDAFYKYAEGDDKLLNSRSSVILHEAAHLIGLSSDAETETLNSAESIRNFTLLTCGIVSEKICLMQIIMLKEMQMNLQTNL